MHSKFTLVKTDSKDIPKGCPVYAVPQLYTTSWPAGAKHLPDGTALFVRQEDLEHQGGWSQEELNSLKESAQSPLDFPENDR